MKTHDYSVRWTAPSRDSSESMPLGGFDIGCNVWVENNEICVYLAQGGAFDENNALLKLGRIRIGFAEGDALAAPFSQTLKLDEGCIRIEAGNGLAVRLWADARRPALHIDYTGETPHTLLVSYDCWRPEDRLLPPEERGQCRDYAGWDGDTYTYKDTVEAEDGRIRFYHRNRSDKLVYDVVMEQQKLNELREFYPNWLLGRTFGGVLEAEGMAFAGTEPGVYQKVPHVGYRLRTRQPVTRQSVRISLHTAQTDTLDDWKRELADIAAQRGSFEETAAWWKHYFERSYIRIDKPDAGTDEWKVGRNYQLFRYMLGCNYYGAWPTKFNGGLFTFDEGRTPDYRNWSGGSHTTQNQRLVYWPMLKTGDFEAMKPQFDFFKHITDAGRARVRRFWGHDGACFPEQLTNFGTSTGFEYGWNRREGVPDAEDDNYWVRYEYSNALEIALMMLRYAEFSGADISVYLPFVKSVVIFYDEHYGTDEEGKLHIFPSSALESYKCEYASVDGEAYGAANPTDAVAGLRATLQALIAYLEDGEEKRRFERMLAKCPDIARGTRDGLDIFLPAARYELPPFNCELPQLYMVFPYSGEGLSDEERRIARNTYRHGWDSEAQMDHTSWHQAGIFAARLGLTDEAHDYLLRKMSDANKRFPAFWGPGHDWTPDHNWGGSGMIGLQEMLMQTDGGHIRLLPAWKPEVDVSFRLHAPNRTVVECVYENGAVTQLRITPESRAGDVIWPAWLAQR